MGKVPYLARGVVPREGRPRGSSGTETSGPRWRSTRTARLAPSWLGGDGRSAATRVFSWAPADPGEAARSAGRQAGPNRYGLSRLSSSAGPTRAIPTFGTPLAELKSMLVPFVAGSRAGPAVGRSHEARQR